MKQIKLADLPKSELRMIEVNIPAPLSQDETLSVGKPPDR